jgi:membrane fusion protein, heavy metal efflux system
MSKALTIYLFSCRFRMIDIFMNSNFCARSITLLSLLSVWVSFSPNALSHSGHSHSNEFGGTEQAGNRKITIDAATAQSLGIKATSVQKQRLPIEIVVTGQIELLPNQKVEITAPIKGKILQTLVQPGAKVNAGQAVATMTSPELGDWRAASPGHKDKTMASLQQAQVELQLAQEGYRRIEQIAKADREQALNQLAAAQARLIRKNQLVKSGVLVQIAKTNYQRQQQISKAEISAARYAVNFASERYRVDLKSATDGIGARRQMLESQARLAEARAVLAKTINQPGLIQAETELRRAETDVPLGELREAEKQVAEAKGQLAKALNQKSLIEADSQIRKAKAAKTAAQNRQILSATYNSPLAPLGNSGQNRVIIVKSPIDGIVADQDTTTGQSVPAAGAKIMTITNDQQILATANIHERDLAKVKIGQEAKVKVGNETFIGTVSHIGSTIDSQSRVVPVHLSLSNQETMKSGTLAELRLITDDKTDPIMAVPSTAIVEADDQKLVYAQNGNSYQPVTVELGQTIGDFVEVKSGLSIGDDVVTQGVFQLYSQSLKAPTHNQGEARPPQGSKIPFNLLWATLSGITVVGTGIWWGFKRNKNNPDVVELEVLEAEIVTDQPNPICQQPPTVDNHSISTYDVEVEDINSDYFASVVENDESKVNREVKAETVVVSSDVVNKTQTHSTQNGANK